MIIGAEMKQLDLNISILMGKYYTILHVLSV